MLVPVVVDAEHVIFLHAVFPGLVADVVQEHALVNDDVRLFLHVTGVAVAEVHVDVLQQLCRDHPGHVHAALSVGVKVEVHACVAVHALVPLRRPCDRLEPNALNDLVHLVAEHA